MTVQIFRSTDAGAPVLNGTAGSLIAVLDHCLVSGLSWTKTAFGGNQVAYTQPGGNHRILQVDDSIGTTANVKGWETLTAFNTGTNPWFPTGGASGVQVQKAPYGAAPLALDRSDAANYALIAFDPARTFNLVGFDLLTPVA
jgi:hypothetical protein